MTRRAVLAGLAALLVAVVFPEPATAASPEGERHQTGPEGETDVTLEGPPSTAQARAREIAEGVERRSRTDRRNLTLMLTGNLGGNFARVDCRQEDGYRDLHWARHAAHYHALRQLAEGTDRSEPVALNVGNSLFPGALGRYLMTRGHEGPERFAELVAEIPLQAHGLGNWELATPRPAFVEFLEAARDHDIPVQAANLDCEAGEGAEAICEGVASSDDDKPYRIVERQGLDVAVTTVLDEEVFDGLSRFQRQGIDVVDPGEVLEPLVETMREEADLVVVQHQVSRRLASRRSYDLASGIEGIDLMVASHLVDSPAEAGHYDPEQPAAGGRMSIIEASSTGTPIVSANSAEYGAINVELDTVLDDEPSMNWTVRRVIPRRVQLEEAPVHEPTRDLLKSSVRNFCDDWGEPIGTEARLAHPFEMEDLQGFILNVMRFVSRSEVALVNRRAFRNQEQFPLTDELTRADIYATLPFENRLVVVDIKGSVLEDLGDRLETDLVGAGIAVDDGDVRINGRSLSADRTYRVAINEFLSEGGDGVFEAGQLQNARYHHPPLSDDPPSIGAIAIEYVESGRHLAGGDGREGVSAEANFPDLEHRFLWSFTGSLNTSYNQVAVANPDGAYDQSQLNVDSTDQINVEGRLTVDADRRYHGWTNNLDIQYATSRLAEDEDGFTTTRDRIRLRSRYRYKRLRAAYDDRWFIPDPFVEGQAESEFQRPADRDFHRLNLRGLTGASFQVLEPLEVQLGVNVSRDVFEPGAGLTWGVNAAYTLARISPVRIADRPVRLQSEVEYFYNDIGRQNIHEARSSNRVFFSIFDQLFFTTTFNAFLYRDDEVGRLGTNTELTVGLNYEWGEAYQSF